MSSMIVGTGEDRALDRQSTDVAGVASRTDANTLRRRPGWTVVLRRQMRLVMLKRRRELLLLGGAAALAAFLRLTGAFPADSVSFARFFAASSLLPLVTFVALLWPGGVWSGEGPGDRAYHWSLPVARPAHDLTRLGAGAAWYLVIVALGLGIGLLTVYLGWGRATPLTRVEVPVAAVLTTVLAYLAGSVPTLFSGHPYRWIFGTYAGGGLALMLSEVVAEKQLLAAWLHEGLRSVTVGDYGFMSAFEAPVRIAAAPGFDGAGGAPWGCLLLWTGVAAAAVAITSLVHLERARGAVG